MLRAPAKPGTGSDSSIWNNLQCCCSRHRQSYTLRYEMRSDSVKSDSVKSKWMQPDDVDGKRCDPGSSSLLKGCYSRYSLQVAKMMQRQFCLLRLLSKGFLGTQNSKTPELQASMACPLHM